MAEAFQSEAMQRGLQELKKAVALRMYAETGAQKLRTYAQQHRRWTDRTGHARQRLTAYVTKVESGYKITLAHGVDYGLWLELAHEKKYGIIPETIRVVGEGEIMPGLEHLMDKLGYTHE